MDAQFNRFVASLEDILISSRCDRAEHAQAYRTASCPQGHVWINGRAYHKDMLRSHNWVLGLAEAAQALMESGGTRG